MIASLRPHARALFWPSLALIASVGAIAFLYGRFDEQWQNLAVLIGGIAIIVLLWAVPMLLWLGRRYTITTRRIILRSGLFVRTRRELLHSRGHDITVRKNALQSMVGSGDVLINTGLDHPVELRDIPSADLVQGSLHDLMEKSVNPIAARRQAEQSSRPDDETTDWGRR
ncbi:MAG: hypothetical protein JWL94_1537 [Microbacteriaceae bacterium]|jgi:uncharacterized membrane protein YdbT with pleckstrin-like domain|nr:hypothetical protein [Microbacteriaceae bacterium]